MKHILLKKISRALLSLILVSSLCFAPLTPLLAPQKTHAYDAVIDATNLVQTTISAIANKASAAFNAITSSATNALVVKEYTLDTIAWALVNKVLESMIQSTTDWINSGFNGKPAFVQDMQGFVLDVADKYALGFIYGGNLNALCSPFKLNVQIALEISYANTREYYAGCRLTDAITNLDGFLNGDFAGGGGWGAWYDITLNPEMNPTGALFLAEGALNAGVSNARTGALFEINLGQGFLSKKDPNCDESLGPCPIITPGQTIQQTLQTSLDIPANRLTIADELDEMIGALLSQLANQALSGAGGLLGLTNSYDSSGNNYFDRMRSEVPPSQDIGDPTIPYFPPPPIGDGGSTTIPTSTPAGIVMVDTGSINTSWARQTFFPNPSTIYSFKVTVPSDFVGTGRFSAYPTSASPRAKLVVLSESPGVFEPLNGQVNCKKSGLDGSTITINTNPAKTTYNCNVTPGKTYYLNAASILPDGTYSCTDTTTCSFYADRSAPY